MVNIHATEDPLQKQCPAFKQKLETYTMHGSGHNKQLNETRESLPSEIRSIRSLRSEVGY